MSELNPYLERDRVLDEWKRPIHVRCGPIAIVLRSAGRDGWLDTADDIVERAVRRAGEAAG